MARAVVHGRNMLAGDLPNRTLVVCGVMRQQIANDPFPRIDPLLVPVVVHVGLIDDGERLGFETFRERL